MIERWFPALDSVLVEDEDGDEWILSYTIFGSNTPRGYESHACAYVLTTDDELSDCPSCLRGDCVQRRVWVVADGDVYTIHGVTDQLN